MKIVIKVTWLLGLLLGLLPAQLRAQFTLSGQIRTRTELRDGFGSPLNENQDPALFTSQRTRLNVGYEGYRTKFFVAMQDVRVWGQDASTNNRVTNADLNGLMLHEAWAEIGLLDTAITKTGTHLSLKIGRQELLYDDSRLLGNLDWLQQARRHDAAVLKYEQNGFMAHLGAAYNQNRESNCRADLQWGTFGLSSRNQRDRYRLQVVAVPLSGKKVETGNGFFFDCKRRFQPLRCWIVPRQKYGKKGTWNRVTLGPYLNTKLGKNLGVTRQCLPTNRKGQRWKKPECFYLLHQYGLSRYIRILP